MFLGCGAGVISRIYYSIIFLGGGACLLAKGNRKTNLIFSLFLFLSIGGMKEIRLMICFIFLRLGKKKNILDGLYPIYIYIYIYPDLAQRRFSIGNVTMENATPKCIKRSYRKRVEHLNLD